MANSSDVRRWARSVRQDTAATSSRSDEPALDVAITPGLPACGWEHARLLRERDRAAARQRALVDLGQHAVGGADLEELLDLALGTASSALPGAVVALVEVCGEDAVLRGCAGRRPGASMPLRLPLAGLAGTTLGRALRGWLPVHVEDHSGERAEGHPAPQPLLPGCAAGSSIAVPVRTPRAVWGALVVAHPAPGCLAAPDVLFLQQVAALVSAAVDRAQTEAANRRTALQDPLTELPNRTRLRQLLEEALRAPGGCGVLLVDLDGFKDVNDALGHAVGDLVLQRVAERLRAAVTAPGVPARLGGDEFAVLLPGATAGAMEHLARDIADAFLQPLTAAAVDVRLGVSAGSALSGAHGTDAATLLRRADVAMHRAKSRAGSWAAYSPSLDAPRLTRLKLVGELRGAIGAGDLEVHYQPVVDLRTGRPCSVEALVRWRHPVRGRVGPEQFIGLAEQSRLIGPLTLWVIDEAVRQSLAWREAGLPRIPVAVNWSIHCLRDPGAADAIHRRLVAHRDLLTVEVTESALADDDARDALQVLAAEGVSCAIDDFGTGYASLAHLRRLPVDRLKVDKLFVEHLAEERKDRAIVRSVVDLAHALGLEVTAEGVESEAVAAELRLLGVGAAQGHLWSPAVEGEEITGAWAGGTAARGQPGPG
ncbi:diguanylate cyclase (GGDEF)-like protein [Kineococcus xinjiangensis]|uniref:Diguanylate cyclase (GGDEF)-like protein n=1 Tax=Kineococcus xinjiangensis TaxID=512762 RepID=A0A2S6IEJ8_9ACTN|nr:EAL domain-containing protein [Kineococcus xinjiangensis]PPK92631.1 diguanylate cyclase (GGDEF)-like protein [Kineococcus xinjiangensis]